MEMIGKCYFNGFGVAKDDKEADKWFSMAYGDNY